MSWSYVVPRCLQWHWRSFPRSHTLWCLLVDCHPSFLTLLQAPWSLSVPNWHSHLMPENARKKIALRANFNRKISRYANLHTNVTLKAFHCLSTLPSGTTKENLKDKKNPVQLIWGESKNIATDVSAIDDLLSWWVFVNDGEKRNRELTHSSFMPLGQRNLLYSDILDYVSFLCANQDHR